MKEETKKKENSFILFVPWSPTTIKIVPKSVHYLPWFIAIGMISLQNGISLQDIVNQLNKLTTIYHIVGRRCIVSIYTIIACAAIQNSNGKLCVNHCIPRFFCVVHSFNPLSYFRLLIVCSHTDCEKKKWGEKFSIALAIWHVISIKRAKVK